MDKMVIVAVLKCLWTLWDDWHEDHTKRRGKQLNLLWHSYALHGALTSFLTMCHYWVLKEYHKDITYHTAVQQASKRNECLTLSSSQQYCWVTTIIFLSIPRTQNCLKRVWHIHKFHVWHKKYRLHRSTHPRMYCIGPVKSLFYSDKCLWRYSTKFLSTTYTETNKAFLALTREAVVSLMGKISAWCLHVKLTLTLRPSGTLWPNTWLCVSCQSCGRPPPPPVIATPKLCATAILSHCRLPVRVDLNIYIGDNTHK